MNLYITMNSFSINEIHQLGYETVLNEIKNSGFMGVEIRRELLNENSPTLSEMRNLLVELNLNAYYSCPIPLFQENHQLNDIAEICDEAIQLEAKLIKFPLGSFHQSYSNLGRLKKLVELLKNQNITVTIENDQTLAGGNATNLLTFLDCSHEKGIPIFFTCDIGNWNYVQEDPEKAINALKKYTKYVHLKEVTATKQGYETVPISNLKDQKWKRLLNTFSADVARAIEFPVTMSNVKRYVSIINEEV